LHSIDDLAHQEGKSQISQLIDGVGKYFQSLGQVNKSSSQVPGSHLITNNKFLLLIPRAIILNQLISTYPVFGTDGQHPLDQIFGIL